MLLPTQGREIRLTPGRILLIPCEVYHGVVTRDGTMERLCFSFSAECPEKENSPIFELFEQIHDVLIFESKNAMTLVEQCRELRQRPDCLLTDDRQGVLLMGTVLELLGSLHSGRRPLAQEVSRATRQKWLIEEYIERHYT